MQITSKTKIDPLLREYPFLLDFLVNLSPKFSKLQSPLMRKTVGRLATMSRAASLGDIALNDLLAAVAGEIRRMTNQDVKVDFGTEEQRPFMDREARLEVLKDIIRDLHRGADLEPLKKRFADLIKDVDAKEISEMEQALIEGGMPAEEVKRLCDVHVQVFKESLERQEPPQAPPGHPVHTLWAENRALEKILFSLDELLQQTLTVSGPAASSALQERLRFDLETISDVEKHYLKKENQLFPLLEAKGVSGPSQVMWAIHDDIRAHLKELKRHVDQGRMAEAGSLGRQVAKEIRDMIYKEEKILFPASLKTLGERDWARVKHGEEEIGYAWVTPGMEWRPSKSFTEKELTMPDDSKPLPKLELERGAMSPELVDLLLKRLPLDLSFVDENDTVVYYSETSDRIFPRSPAVIGRKVQNCHPPASIHVVNKILEAFKSGKKDAAKFWIQTSGKFILIRYLAVRNKNGAYQGCLEVSQDVTDIRTLDGQKRLLDWD